MHKLFVASVLGLGLLSCGGTKQNAPPAEASAAEPVVGPPDVAWKDMTKEQRGHYMKVVVMPKMKAAFQAFDPKEFAEPTCATCHGENAKEKGFEMPNPNILVLPSTEEAFMATTMKEHPAGVKFMSETVTPQMAALLGRAPFDPAHPAPDAFSCGACHTLEGQPAHAVH